MIKFFLKPIVLTISVVVLSVLITYFTFPEKQNGMRILQNSNGEAYACNAFYIEVNSPDQIGAIQAELRKIGDFASNPMPGQEIFLHVTIQNENCDENLLRQKIGLVENLPGVKTIHLSQIFFLP